jgi:hypothetical protein
MGNAPVAPPINTVRARILPGWMTRDEAINYLTLQCHPQMSVADAEHTWQEYRTRCAALPANRAPAPQFLPLSTQEAAQAQLFMQFINSRGPHQVVGAVKIDLRQLVVIQYYVITERADSYRQRITSAAAWLAEMLPTTLAPATIQTSFSLGPPNNANQLSSSIDIDVPHAEFAFLPADPTGSVFGASQFLRHVTACETANRVLLRAGYHRSFARVLNAPAATVPTAVIALERNTCVAPPNQTPAGAGAITGGAGLNPFGLRPALLADFFTTGLFMDVNLRRKRYQLQVRCTWLELDA